MRKLAGLRFWRKNWEIKIKMQPQMEKSRSFPLHIANLQKKKSVWKIQICTYPTPHSSCTFTEMWSHGWAVKWLQGSPVWLCMATFKSNQPLNKVKLGLNQTSHGTNTLTSLIKPLMNLEKQRAENGGLLFQ